MINKSIEELAEGIIKAVEDKVKLSVNEIIQQLKNQVIFNQCRKYIKLGCKVRSISVSDDFESMDMDVILPGQIKMMDIQAGFEL